jgi:hypothetical protein
MDLDETSARLKLKSITFDLIKQVASKNVRGASTPPNEIVILSDFKDSAEFHSNPTQNCYLSTLYQKPE